MSFKNKSSIFLISIAVIILIALLSYKTKNRSIKDKDTKTTIIQKKKTLNKEKKIIKNLEKELKKQEYKKSKNKETIKETKIKKDKKTKTNKNKKSYKNISLKNESFYPILDNINNLEDTVTEKGKKSFRAINKILDADPEKVFTDIKEILNSDILETETEKQFLIQLLNRTKLEESKKIDFLEKILHKYSDKEIQNLEGQELYTLEIAISSAKQNSKTKESQKNLNIIIDNLPESRLKNLVNN